MRIFHEQDASDKGKDRVERDKISFPEKCHGMVAAPEEKR
jgi:hypothetical protein